MRRSLPHSVLLAAPLLALAACSGGDGPTAHPAPPHALLEVAEGLAGEAGDVVFSDDLSGADLASGVVPAGWTPYLREDLTREDGRSVVSLVRAVEALEDDLDVRIRVLEGPVHVRVARLPEAAGPIPAAADLRAWIQDNAQGGDELRVSVAEGEEDLLEARLGWATDRAVPMSARVLLSVDMSMDAGRVGLVELARRPSFEVQYQSAVYGAPHYAEGPVRGRVNLGGDHRDSLVVPAGATVTAPLGQDAHLAGRTALQLALGALVGDEPAALVPLAGRLALVDGDATLLEEPFRLDPLATPADRAWRDRTVDLAGLPLTPTTRLEVTVDPVAGLAPDRPQAPALALAHPRLVGGTDARPRPNLVLVSLDTLRGDRVGPRADGSSLTPNLDAFAEGALVYTAASSPAPFTLPSHGTVFTGLLPTAHGGIGVETPMRTGAGTLTELLALAGWTTTAFTGGGFMSPDFGFARGFERYTIHDPLITTETLPGLDELGVDLTDASAVAREQWENYLRLEAAWRLKRPAVSAWLEQAAGPAAPPFFLFLHTYAAHQYHPPRHIYEEHMAGTASTWTFGRQLPSLSPEAFAADPPSAADRQHLIDLYDACVVHADDEFGAVLADLKARGLLDTSYVVVFSDHGEELFEHGPGNFGHSNSLRESLLHVPLMLAGPGIEPGVVARPVTLLDLPPTLCALLDLPVPEAFQGVSLLDAVGTPDAPAFAPTDRGSEVFAEVSHGAYHRDALRLEDWKLVRDYGADGRVDGDEGLLRLHDLDEQGEARDLAGDQPLVLERLLERLEQRRAAADAAAAGLPDDRGGVSDATKDMLGDLGYL